MTRSVFTAVALTVGAAGLMACGDGVDPSTQQQIGGERFEKIRFAELYRPPNSTSKVKETIDLVETESLSLEGASPQSVLGAYSKVLKAEGWEEVNEPQQKRDKSWYGSWTRLGRTVVVVAEFGTAAEEGEQPPTDFVLSFQRPTKNDRITGVENRPIDE
jgi:hypothetical protein